MLHCGRGIRLREPVVEAVRCRVERCPAGGLSVLRLWRVAVAVDDVREFLHRRPRSRVVLDEVRGSGTRHQLAAMIEVVAVRDEFEGMAAKTSTELRVAAGG